MLPNLFGILAGVEQLAACSSLGVHLTESAGSWCSHQRSLLWLVQQNAMLANSEQAEMCKNVQRHGVAVLAINTPCTSDMQPGTVAL